MYLHTHTLTRCTLTAAAAAAAVAAAIGKSVNDTRTHSLCPALFLVFSCQRASAQSSSTQAETLSLTRTTTVTTVSCSLSPSHHDLLSARHAVCSVRSCCSALLCCCFWRTAGLSLTSQPVSQCECVRVCELMGGVCVCVCTHGERESANE